MLTFKNETFMNEYENKFEGLNFKLNKNEWSLLIK